MNEWSVFWVPPNWFTTCDHKFGSKMFQKKFLKTEAFPGFFHHGILHFFRDLERAEMLSSNMFCSRGITERGGPGGGWTENFIISKAETYFGASPDFIHQRHMPLLPLLITLTTYHTKFKKSLLRLKNVCLTILILIIKIFAWKPQSSSIKSLPLEGPIFVLKSQFHTHTLRAYKHCIIIKRPTNAFFFMKGTLSNLRLSLV